MTQYLNSIYNSEKTKRGHARRRNNARRKSKRGRTKRRKDATGKDDKIKDSNGVFSHGIISSFRAEISSFHVAGFVFRFLHGVISSFPRAFFFFLVFSTFRVACFPREKTKRHYSATIVDRLSYFVLTVHDILISDGHLISELRHFIIN